MARPLCPLNFSLMFVAWAIVPEHYFLHNNRAESTDCRGNSTVEQPITATVGKQHGTAAEAACTSTPHLVIYLMSEPPDPWVAETLKAQF